MMGKKKEESKKHIIRFTVDELEEILDNIHSQYNASLELEGASAKQDHEEDYITVIEEEGKSRTILFSMQLSGSYEVEI